MTVKHYKPGTPEFDEIARTITHISKVPSRKPDPKLSITAEEPHTPKSFRNETIDKMR